jgi:hypothetical protein
LKLTNPGINDKKKRYLVFVTILNLLTILKIFVQYK